jgi:DNA-binding CsgD family transcriptional regulator
MMTTTVSAVAEDGHEPLPSTLDCTDNLENLVARAGLPVIERLAEDLGNLAMSIELTDSSANVICRVIGAHVLTTALDDDGASVAAPITDPRRGVAVGAIRVTCALPAAGALLLPFAQLAARTISDRMVDSAAVADRVLLEEFLRARRRARGPILAVNANELLTNAAAARLVRTEDHVRIWTWVLNAIESNGLATRDLEIGASTVFARCEPVRVGGDIVGAVVHLEDLSPPSKTTPPPGPVRSTSGGSRLGWESLLPSELGIAELVAEGLTNREVAARIFVSPYTVDFHLRQIYRKLSITSRIALTRMVLEHGAASSGNAILVR